MADYLYVCEFSSGHIKVGRSVEPGSRIASHADRLSCLGVELTTHKFFLCVESAATPERALIAKCAEHATRRRGEWFEGVTFDQACEWAAQCSCLRAFPESNSFGDRLALWMELRGFTRQGAFAERIGISQPSLSELIRGHSVQPAALTLLNMADALSLNPRYLLTGEGPQEPARTPD